MARSTGHLQTLRERAAYLGARIAAKQSVGWQWEYDQRERDALLWAIDKLQGQTSLDRRARAEIETGP